VLAEREKEAADRRVQEYAEYTRLARRAAAGKLERNQAARFGILLDNLTIPTDEAAADQRVLTRAIQLEAAASDLPAAIQLHDKRMNEVRAVQAEVRAEMEKLQRREADAIALYYAAKTPLDDARRADSELKDLRSRHWRLLGAENPQIAARRRHLVSVLYEQAPAAVDGYDVQSIEALMSQDAFSLVNLDRVDWIRLPDQPTEEFQRLVGIAVELVNAAIAVTRHQSSLDSPRMPVFKYLLPADPAVQGRVLNKSCVMFVFSTPNWPTNMVPGKNFRVVAAPGQSQEQIEQLLSKIQKRLEQQAKEAGEAPPTVYQESARVVLPKHVAPSV